MYVRVVCMYDCHFKANGFKWESLFNKGDRICGKNKFGADMHNFMYMYQNMLT